MGIFLRLLALAGLATLLQSCLLYYFLAPKILPENLPGETSLAVLQQAYNQQCGRCHQLVDPSYFDREHPIQAYTQRYQAQNLLNEREALLVVTYIQALAFQTP